MKKTNLTPAKELSILLNNALFAAMRPASSGEIPEKRMARLRVYTEAILEPLFRHIEEELIRPEELVFVFTSAAVFTQQKHIMKSDKLPLAGVAERAVGKGGKGGK